MQEQIRPPTRPNKALLETAPNTQTAPGRLQTIDEMLRDYRDRYVLRNQQDSQPGV